MSTQSATNYYFWLGSESHSPLYACRGIGIEALRREMRKPDGVLHLANGATITYIPGKEEKFTSART